jgi:hypothetical protein
MKKSILVLSMASLMLVGSLKTAVSQDQPKPKKDTVNTFYYAEEEKADSKGGFPTIAVGSGVAVLVALGIIVILRKKKK